MVVVKSPAKSRTNRPEHPFDAFQKVRAALGASLPSCVRERSCLISASECMDILLVEDDADSASVLRRLLERHHYAVAIAGCAAEARWACGNKRFDLLICDIGLPDENGWSLMPDLRDRYGLKGIALTAFAAPADFDKSRQAGFAAHLTKPLSVEALLAAIRDADKRSM